MRDRDDSREFPPPALLEARGLIFLRQDEPVFGPLDFRLRAGEILLVEGDNGSGKTTLLRVIAGLLHADDGDCSWTANRWIATVSADACCSWPTTWA